MTKRISWHELFMSQCYLFAQRSTCTRLAVGSVIVRDNRIISGGYNGSVSGGIHCIDEGCNVVNGHCINTIHSEANSLYQCAKYGTRTEGAAIYVTHYPCLNCTKAIIQAGITEVYYAEDYKNDAFAICLFEQANVTVKQVGKPTLHPKFQEV